MDQYEHKGDETAKVRKIKYPKAVFFIIGNEFCERFSYLGLKTILTLYFTDVFLTSDDMATAFFHMFAAINYIAPLAGAIISDSYWGKFRTILYLSIFYAIGDLTIAFSSIVEIGWITIIGLLLNTLGNGGIKPCVAAFGGDQFVAGQEKQLQRFFSIFYVTIMTGGFFSSIVAPILRQDVHCFDRTTCFPLAFGVPAFLMLFALGLFIAGKFLTNYIIVPPVKENIFFKIVQIIFFALNKKMFGTEKRDHWLDHASPKFDEQIIADVKVLTRVLFLYLPIPICWALLLQPASRWILQARAMDSDFFCVYRIKPDQMGMFHMLLFMLIAPILDYAIYPLIERLGVEVKPLRKLIVGGLFTAVSFIICGLIQVRIESDLPVLPTAGQGYAIVANGLNCRIDLENSNNWTTSIEPLAVHDWQVKQLHQLTFEATVFGDSDECKIDSKIDLTLQLKEYEQAIFVIGRNEYGLLVEKYSIANLLTAPKRVSKSAAFFLILFNNFLFDQDSNDLALKNDFTSDVIYLPLEQAKNNQTTFRRSKYQEIDIFKHEENFVLKMFGNSIFKEIYLKQGGGYVIFINNSTGKIETSGVKTIVKPNSVKVLYQLIPWVFLTVGAVMFDITAPSQIPYSQSPVSMKSVQQSLRLVAMGVGNLIIAVVAAGHFFNHQSHEFFFLAALLIVDLIVFSVMAFFYIPYDGKSLVS